MRLLIFEPGRGGHHTMYLARMLPHLAGLADAVDLVLHPDTPQDPSFREHLPQLPPNATVHPAPPLNPRICPPARAVARQLLDAVDALNPDHILAPTGEAAAIGLGLSLTPPKLPPLQAAIVRTQFVQPANTLRDRLSRRIARAAYARCPAHRLLPIDLYAYQHIRAHYPDRFTQRFRLLPDPLDPVTDDRLTQLPNPHDTFGLNPDARYIGCAGVFSKRKGIDRLLAAFEAAQLPGDARLLLLGRCEPDTQQLLRDAQPRLGPRLHLVERFLSDDELLAALRVMHLVVTPYLNHFGPSGIVLRAAQLGRPVLTPHTGWLGRITRDFHLGHTTDVLNADAFAQTLQEADLAAHHHQPRPATADLLRFHHPDNYARTWAIDLRQQLNLPPDPGVVSPDTILQHAQTHADP
ncbi:MAG: glycosyltransferase family 4 protein [Planctomycetota bacterium]